MKIYMELYNKDKTYISPNGQYLTPESMLATHPAINDLVHIVRTDSTGKIMFEFDSLAHYRLSEDIPDSVSDDQAVQLVAEIRQAQLGTPIPTSAEERIAAALEYQNLML